MSPKTPILFIGGTHDGERHYIEPSVVTVELPPYLPRMSAAEYLDARSPQEPIPNELYKRHVFTASDGVHIRPARFAVFAKEMSDGAVMHELICKYPRSR